MKNCQVVFPRKFDINKVVFGKPRDFKYGKKVDIEYLYSDGTHGPILLQTPKLLSYGVQKRQIDGKEPQYSTHFVFDDIETAQEKLFLEIYDKITQKCIDTFGETEKIHIPSMSRMYGTKNRSRPGFNFFPKMIYDVKFLDNNKKQYNIATKFYDCSKVKIPVNQEPEIHMEQILKRRCKMVGLIMIDTLTINHNETSNKTYLYLNPKLYEANVWFDNKPRIMVLSSDVVYNN